MMETYQIASWLRDKAVRSGDHSWERMMMMASKRLEELEEQLKKERERNESEAENES